MALEPEKGKRIVIRPDELAGPKAVPAPRLRIEPDEQPWNRPVAPGQPVGPPYAAPPSSGAARTLVVLAGTLVAVGGVVALIFFLLRDPERRADSDRTD